MSGVKLTAFKLRVDGGEVHDFTTSTGIYSQAVMQAFGKLDMPFPCDVEIWVEDLLPEYGPYFYRIDGFTDRYGNFYGCPAVMNSRPAGRLALSQGGGE